MASGVSDAAIEIVVPRLPGIANFTDLDALAVERGVAVRYVTSPAEWRSPALVVLPGTRNTIADLGWLRETGLARCITQHAAGGGRVVGLCGGYQMLGREIRDPERVESGDEAVPGLALLDVVTTFVAGKQVTRARGLSTIPGLEELPVEGYEIHHGRTELGLAARPALQIHERQALAGDLTDGAVDGGGKVFGTYLHGLFDSPAFRRPFLRLLGWVGTDVAPQPSAFDRLADWLETHAAMDCLLSLTRVI